MQPAPKPHNETERLASLKKYNLLDTLPEHVYNDIARLASEICGTPMAMFSLIDDDRQWVKAKTGIDLVESPRDISFCAHVIVNPNEPFVVEDARYDERFHDNPFTTEEPHIVFYAGIPILDPQGNALGSLCVLDNRPRELSDQKLEALKALAKLVQTHLELRRVMAELEQSKAKLGTAQTALEQVKKITTDLLGNNPRPEQIAPLQALQQSADLQ
jgi:hypothetical protein